jgi:condensin-2 complex subunit D3
LKIAIHLHPRYTAIVDKYLPALALCLRDPIELVRRQSLMLLTRLLQEDFVKWRGTLFYRFLVSLVDESPDIQQFGIVIIPSILLCSQFLLCVSAVKQKCADVFHTFCGDNLPFE